MLYEKVKQVNNPSDQDRYALLMKALTDLGRPDDFNTLIRIASPPPDITTILQKGSCKNLKIGIIGAGSAGLAAALELKKVGCNITMYEGEKDHIGGRIHTHYFTDELYGELGPMRIPVSHETVWHYINKFKLKTNPFLQNTDNNILYVKNTRLYGQDIDRDVMKYLYPKFDLTQAEKNTSLSNMIEFIYNYPILQTKSEIREFFYKILPKYPYEINKFDYLNLRKACQQLDISNGAINFLSSVLGIDRNLFYNNYIEMLREEYFANYSYVYEIQGGFSQLPLAMYNSLIRDEPGTSRVNVKKGCRVKGLYYKPQDDQVIVKYLNRFTNQERSEQFDYVICAIPFSTLRLIETFPQFSNEKMQAIREVNYSPSQKTSLLCNKRFWERAIDGKTILGGGSITDLPINTIWYPSQKYNNQYGVITGSYNINLDATRVGNLDESLRIDAIKQQIEEVHSLPRGYLDDIVEDYKTINWNVYDLYLGAFCVYNPEQNRLFSYASRVPEYNKRLFFAGEHTSPFHAWIQGGLQSGMEVANMVVDEYKMKQIKNRIYHLND